MEDNTVEIPCPSCKEAFRDVPISPRLAACARCGERVQMDECFREALDIATSNDAWIEKIFWKESNNGVLVILVVFLIDFPLTVLKFAGWFVVLCSIGLVNGQFFGTAPIGWLAWSLIPLGFIAAYLILWLLKRGIKKGLANQFVTVAHFIVSSRGLIVVSPYPQPLFLPWSSIVDYSWTSQVETMTSIMHLRYATADNQVATIVLEGEEVIQPLGELVDILDARLQR